MAHQSRYEWNERRHNPCDRWPSETLESFELVDFTIEDCQVYDEDVVLPHYGDTWEQRLGRFAR